MAEISDSNEGESHFTSSISLEIIEKQLGGFSSALVGTALLLPFCAGDLGAK
jgi:hypothetical protein